MEQKVIPISFGMVKAFLVKGQKCVLIDTGLPGKLSVILEELKKNSVSPEDISLIVATHNHADHVGEMAALKELTKAKTAIHKSEAPGLRDGKTTETKPVTLLGSIIRKLFKGTPFKGISPDVIIEDELQLKEFGVEGRIIHTPGHTPGSVTIILANGEIIVGDMFSGKKTRKGEKAALPIFAADLRELKRSLEKIISLSPTKIHNSHGETIGASAVKELVKSVEKKVAREG